jgi:hypothetical protein
MLNTFFFFSKSKVLAPKLCSILAKYKLVEFFPMGAFGYLSDVTKQIIEKRKTKQEVYRGFYFKFNFRKHVYLGYTPGTFFELNPWWVWSYSLETHPTKFKIDFTGNRGVIPLGHNPKYAAYALAAQSKSLRYIHINAYNEDFFLTLKDTRRLYSTHDWSRIRSKQQWSCYQ